MNKEIIFIRTLELEFLEINLRVQRIQGDSEKYKKSGREEDFVKELCRKHRGKNEVKRELSQT